MLANGHRPVSRFKNTYKYRCPSKFHNDADASFCVEAAPSDGAPAARFHCFGCDDMDGWGAIELQAKLFGIGLEGSDYMRVVTYLSKKFSVPVDGVSMESEHYVLVDPVSEFSYTEGEWTDAHLKSLGCLVQPVFHPADKGEPEMASDENVYSWSMVGENGHREPFLTTSAQIGADIQERFSLFPLGEFTLPAKKQADGTMRSYRLRTSDTYPVFGIRTVDEHGFWRIKKYEPYSRPDKNGRSYKWTWWYQGNSNRNAYYRTSLYGDVDVIDAIYHKDVVPTDTSLHHDHPVVDVTHYNSEGQIVTDKKFRRVVICSGPRDALQVFYHSDCHVVYPHSETSVIDDRLIKRLFAIAEQVYVLFDADKTGVREARELNLRFLTLRNIELPADLSRYVDRRTGKPCKDASGYFEYYSSTLGKRGSIDDHFEALLSSSFPIQFWSRKRIQSNVEKPLNQYHYRYALDFKPMTKFLSYAGMRKMDCDGQTRFVVIKDNIVEFVNDRQLVSKASEILLKWVEGYNAYSMADKSELINKIVSSKQLLSYESLQHLESAEPNFKYWGEFHDYDFFRNGAVLETAESRKLVPYSQLDFYVNKEMIMPMDWEETEDEFAIEQNPELESMERSHREQLDIIPIDDASSIRRENERWVEQKKLWQYKLTLNKRMNDCCDELQYIYDTGRVYWRDEYKARSEGKRQEDWLDPDRRQFQDMQFVNKVAGIGYTLTRYRADSAQYIAYLVDYTVADEGKATGRTGKSILGKVMSVLCHSCEIAGTGLKDTPDMMARNFHNYDYMRDVFININDLRDAVKPRTFYNWAEGQLTRKNLHKDEVDIPKDMCAKILMSSNHVMNLADDSTYGRMWLMYVSDYYHQGRSGIETWNPNLKFHHDLGKETDYRDRLRIVNLLIKCKQVYLAIRDKVEAPIGDAGLRRILYSAFVGSKLNVKFIKWADLLFANDMFWGVPLPKQDLVISWLQFVGVSIDKNVVNACKLSGEFQKMLDLYCEYTRITINPTIVLTTKREKQYKLVESDAHVYDLNNPGTPFSGRRSYRTRQGCYLFYRVGEEPTEFTPSQKNQLHSSDPACEGYII